MIDCYNESALLKRVAESDREAYKIIYTQYLDDIYRYVLLFTKSKEATEEIVQNVFVKLWERREGLASIVSFRPYLYRCAKNMLIDEMRRKKVGKKAYDAIQPSSAESNEKSDGRIIYKEYSRIAQNAISYLPAKRREIVELHTKHDYSFDEIADKLSISKSVVKKQLYAGMLFIRTYLKKHGELDI